MTSTALTSRFPILSRDYSTFCLAHSNLKVKAETKKLIVETINRFCARERERKKPRTGNFVSRLYTIEILAFQWFFSIAFSLDSERIREMSFAILNEDELCFFFFFLKTKKKSFFWLQQGRQSHYRT